MKGRKLIIGFVGATQEVIGALTIGVSYILYYDLFDVRIWLDISSEHVFFYLLLLSVFGFVSIISGLFLLHELLQ